ncbi:MAG: class I SAM-dependent RNA methyltransferase [Proteobacteria bacterium]|nr:class I SAM-dependent RNA methyltransferase [Pseudomonadota bacterium]
MDNTETNLELKIDSLAYGGSGVGRLPEGKVVFVPLTAPGDVIRFRKVRERKGYIEGEMVELISPSPLRQEAPCPAFGDCGGCAWQHLPYEQQLKEKESIFRETLWRLGTVERGRIDPVVPSPESLNYRNRAQFKASYVEGRLHLGFYRRKSHDLIDIGDCPLMSPLINKLMSQFKSLLAGAPFRARMSQIDISVDDKDTKATAIIHITTRPTGEDRAFAEKSLDSLSCLNGLFFKSGQKRSLTAISVREGGKLSYSLPMPGDAEGLDMAFSSGGFTQVNYLQNRALISHVLDFLKGRDIGRALDLFCGIGNFSLPLAALAGEVIAVEDYAPAIEDAKLNALSAGIGNCRFFAADARQFVRKEDLNSFDLVLLDPPREGAASIAKQLASSDVPQIIYVSCNATTLARDLRLLTRKGYCITRCTPFDLFPQTGHIESVTLIEKG